jgi:hypothetical protein
MRNGFARLLGWALLGVALSGCLHDEKKSSKDSDDETVTYTAMLSGHEQVPAIKTNAAGYGSLVVNPKTRGVTGVVNFMGFTASGAHVHSGAAGANGSTVITLTVNNTNGSAAVPAGTTLTQAQYDDLIAGNLYFNVHSSDNSNGEIRGQIGRVVMVASLDGDQEVPPVTTSATGTAMVVVNPGTLSLSGSLSTTGIVASAAHIHAGAPGANGGPMVTLTLGSNSASVPNVTTLTSSQYEQMRTGKTYFNVHSATHTGGEIRGQIGPVVMTATLDGNQEVPPVTTAASGQAVFIVDPVSRALSGGTKFAGFSATNAHIHSGAAGVSGAAIVTLVVDNNTGSAMVPGSTVLTQDQFNDLLAGNLYVNVHSTTYPGGEIRGQIKLP